MTFAKQWSDAQVADLAEKCARRLFPASDEKGRLAVRCTVELLLGDFIGLLLRVLGSVGAHHGTVNCYFIWGCRCDPCTVEGEREEARLERQGRSA